MGNPERRHLVLVDLHLVGKIAGVVGLAAEIDKGRQVTTLADGIHGREEDELISAQQVADIVL